MQCDKRDKYKIVKKDGDRDKKFHNLDVKCHKTRKAQKMMCKRANILFDVWEKSCGYTCMLGDTSR